MFINLIVLIFVWMWGLVYCGKLDENQVFIDFVQMLERVCIEIVEFGFMMKDLVLLVGEKQLWFLMIGFFDKVDENL